MKHLVRAAYCAILSNWLLFTSLFYVFGAPEPPLKRLGGAMVLLCASGALNEWVMVEKKRFEDEYGEL